MSVMRPRIERQPAFRPEISLDEIQHIGHFGKALDWLFREGVRRGDSTGWRNLDEFYTVRAREWTLLTGIPSHGKSSFLDNLMVNLSCDHGWNWGIFSAENLPLERHAASLSAIYTGRPFSDGARPRMSQSAYLKARMFLDQHFRFICPQEDDCTIDRVLQIAGMIHEHWGLQGLVIDPWNELDHSRPANMNETEYISRALTKVRRFARERETHVFLVAHPTKLQRVQRASVDAAEATVYPVPTPYDVSGSAHFRNKADNCLCVWRDVSAPQTPTQIHVQKIRFREVGKVGVCELYYDPPTGQFIAHSEGPARRLNDNAPASKPEDLAAFLTASQERIKRAGLREREPGEDDE